MKTAMQEMIQWIVNNQFPINKEFVEKTIELTMKEKEQIIKARIDGDENYSLVGGKRYEYAEQYYNETYNQNES
jgi:hypothetical protein